MQRHKSVAGSTTETPVLESDSSSSNAMCWSNVGSHERHNSNRWNLHEPGSSSIQNTANHNEEYQHEQNLIFSQNNIANQNEGWFMQNSTSSFPSQSRNFNSGFVNHVNDDCLVIEDPNSYRPNEPLNEYVTEDNDFRPRIPLEGLRLSQKRKTAEENIGQSSVSGSSRGHGSIPTHFGHVNPNPNSRRAVHAQTSQTNAYVWNNPPYPYGYVPMYSPYPMGYIPGSFQANPSHNWSSAPPVNQTHGQNFHALPQNTSPIRPNPSLPGPAAWGRHNQDHLSSHYPQRLSENVSIGSESGGFLGGHSMQQSVTLVDQGNNLTQQQPGSSLSTGRQGDSTHGLPSSSQSAADGGEERNRRASQIRSILEPLRRGERLRFEDLITLDRSTLVLVANALDRHRGMRVDVDNMSYEELLALEERIGNVSTGLSEETVLTLLKQRKYADIEIEAHSTNEPCSICQEEYKGGEDLGLLECGHEFHTSCIKQWLLLKNLCPICKTEAIVSREDNFSQFA